MNTTGLKFGGRKAGTPNKATKKTKEIIASIVEENLSTLNDDIKSLEPKDRINAMLQLMKYVTPQLKAIEHEYSDASIDVFKPVVIQFQAND